MSPRDSAVLKPRLLGVDGVGVVGVGIDETEVCAECPNRDPGLWKRDTGAPLSETGSKLERARSCEGWNLGSLEIVPCVFVLVKLRVIVVLFDGLVGLWGFCLMLRLSVSLAESKTSPSPISKSSKKLSFPNRRFSDLAVDEIAY